MKSSITSEVVSEEQKKQYLRFIEDAALKALKTTNPGKTGIQQLIQKGDEFQVRIVTAIRELSVSNKFADEEVKSSYTYPESYKGAKPIVDQIKTLVELFGVKGDKALQYAKSLPELIKEVEWFAIPRFQLLASSEKDLTLQYCKAMEILFQKIKASRSFYNWREGQIDPQHLRVSGRTIEAIAQLEKEQSGDILIVPIQLGLKHRGRSVRRAIKCFESNEFGLWSFAVGIIALTHPERFTDSDELDIDCAGDEFSDGDGTFDKVPYFYFYDYKLKFDSRFVSNTVDGFGSASFFLRSWNKILGILNSWFLEFLGYLRKVNTPLNFLKNMII